MEIGSMAHSQKSQRDHARPHHQPQVNNAVIAEQIELLVSPAVYAQAGYYRQLGLSSRVLNLPLMMAAVLTLLWRQVPSVHELTRLLAREDILWCQAVKVSQQALPLERISVEMLFRGLYHFTQAHAKGLADDPVQYFIAPENRDLAVVKVERKPPPLLNLDPFPKSLTMVAFS
jgi:hypothetical protein